jgi:WS/DGAT/MGAT family acyltransferase
MKQLSGLDELFLALERPNQCTHLAMLGIYDPASAPGGRVRLRDVMNHMHHRLDVSPVFRRRLVRVPFDLDRAWWVDEAKVDLEYHIRHIALPKPGDWRQLCIQIARLHSQALDRAKPLWQAYVIEGLDNVEGAAPGSFAVYIKFHRAAIEGEPSAQILRALHSLIAVPEHHAVTRPTVVDAAPTAVELYARTWGNLAPRGARLWHAVARTTLKLTSLATESMYRRFSTGSSWRQDFFEGIGWPSQKGAARYSGNVSSRRIVEGVGLPLAGIHQIRKWAGGASINDVFLAVVGGALRRYAVERGEPVDAALAACVPSTQRDTLPGGDTGMRISYSRLKLHAEIIAPMARLDAIRRDAAESRQTADVVGRDLIQQLAEELPTQIAVSLTRRIVPEYLNILASTVRGPDVPLYFAGARLTQYFPIGVVLDGLGLSIAGFSYCDTLWVSIVSCRKMMPDPETFARAMETSFAELWDSVQEQERAHQTMHPIIERRISASDARKPRAARRKPTERGTVTMPKTPSAKVRAPAKTGGNEVPVTSLVPPGRLQ